MGEQSGAVGSCWARNPGVDESELLSALFSHVAGISVFGYGNQAVIYDLRNFHISRHEPAIAQLVERRTVVFTSDNPSVTATNPVRGITF